MDLDRRGLCRVGSGSTDYGRRSKGVLHFFRCQLELLLTYIIERCRFNDHRGVTIAREDFHFDRQIFKKKNKIKRREKYAKLSSNDVWDITVNCLSIFNVKRIIFFLFFREQKN